MISPKMDTEPRKKKTNKLKMHTTYYTTNRNKEYKTRKKKQKENTNPHTYTHRTEVPHKIDS